MTKLCLILIPMFFCLFIGVYEEEEFKDKYLFIKHKPSVCFYFSSPLSYREDGIINNLSKAEKMEQERYNDFVFKNGGWKRSLYIPLGN